MTARAALITGGSSGIGLAIAQALGDEGYGLTICGRGAAKLEAAAARLRTSGFETNAVATDVRHDQGLAALVKAHHGRFGRLDVLVNNAGAAIRQPVDDLETSALDLQLAVNLRSYVLLTREALPLLRRAGAEHGKALIVNTASDVGKWGAAGISIYAATKFAVVGFSQSLQKEVGAHGVQVTALCPGYVDTQMTAGVHDRISPQDMIRPTDVAEGTRFLLRTSQRCHIPELIFQRPGHPLDGASD